MLHLFLLVGAGLVRLDLHLGHHYERSLVLSSSSSANRVSSGKT